MPSQKVPVKQIPRYVLETACTQSPHMCEAQVHGLRVPGPCVLPAGSKAVTAVRPCGVPLENQSPLFFLQFLTLYFTGHRHLSGRSVRVRVTFMQRGS